MNYFVYNADVWCPSCTREIKKHLKAEGKRPAGYKDENLFDSDEWPKGPYDAKQESADSPQHCAANDECLEPIVLPDGSKIGAQLSFQMTSVGARYVQDAIDEDPESEVVKLWAELYAEEISNLPKNPADDAEED